MPPARPPQPTDRVLIRCRSGRHQVALDPARFWAPAGCPVCRTAVDPFRVRRAAAWLGGAGPRAGLALPAGIRVSPLELLGLAAIAGAGALGLGLRTLGDAWWPATAVLFAGRWPWMVPAGFLLVLGLLLRQWRAAGLAAAALATTLAFVMGATLGVGRWLGGGDPATRIRLITYNVDGRAMSLAGLMDLVERYQPDVLAIQECGEAVIQAAPLLTGYQFRRSSLCLLSRFPVDTMLVQPRRDIEQIGGSGQVIRYLISGPGGPFSLVNLHLETPRDGLEALLGRSARAPDLIDEETTLRNIESGRARAWADSAPPPLIVAGDFNTPKESVIFRRHWGDLTEAFDRAGFGFGHSKFTRLFGLRIDHVLVDDRWSVKRAEILPDFGSDHRPMLVELELRR
ncbi:MAG: endonuclease/exonuclease/phosphatase family protein [Gemmatimonadales bacterium]